MKNDNLNVLLNRTTNKYNVKNQINKINSYFNSFNSVNSMSMNSTAKIWNKENIGIGEN